MRHSRHRSKNAKRQRDLNGQQLYSPTRNISSHTPKQSHINQYKNHPSSSILSRYRIQSKSILLHHDNHRYFSDKPYRPGDIYDPREEMEALHRRKQTIDRENPYGPYNTTGRSVGGSDNERGDPYGHGYGSDGSGGRRRGPDTQDGPGGRRGGPNDPKDPNDPRGGDPNDPTEDSSSFNLPPPPPPPPPPSMDEKFDPNKDWTNFGRGVYSQSEYQDTLKNYMRAKAEHERLNKPEPPLYTEEWMEWQRQNMSGVGENPEVTFREKQPKRLRHRYDTFEKRFNEEWQADYDKNKGEEYKQELSINTARHQELKRKAYNNFKSQYDVDRSAVTFGPSAFFDQDQYAKYKHGGEPLVFDGDIPPPIQYIDPITLKQQQATATGPRPGVGPDGEKIVIHESILDPETKTYKENAGEPGWSEYSYKNKYTGEDLKAKFNIEHQQEKQKLPWYPEEREWAEGYEPRRAIPTFSPVDERDNDPAWDPKVHNFHDMHRDVIKPGYRSQIVWFYINRLLDGCDTILRGVLHFVRPIWILFKIVLRVPEFLFKFLLHLKVETFRYIERRWGPAEKRDKNVYKVLPHMYKCINDGLSWLQLYIERWSERDPEVGDWFKKHNVTQMTTNIMNKIDTYIDKKQGEDFNKYIKEREKQAQIDAEYNPERLMILASGWYQRHISTSFLIPNNSAVHGRDLIDSIYILRQDEKLSKEIFIEEQAIFEKAYNEIVDLQRLSYKDTLGLLFKPKKHEYALQVLQQLRDEIEAEKQQQLQKEKDDADAEIERLRLIEIEKQQLNDIDNIQDSISHNQHNIDILHDKKEHLDTVTTTHPTTTSTPKQQQRQQSAEITALPYEDIYTSPSSISYDEQKEQEHEIIPVPFSPKSPESATTPIPTEQSSLSSSSSHIPSYESVPLSSSSSSDIPPIQQRLYTNEHLPESPLNSYNPSAIPLVNPNETSYIQPGPILNDVQHEIPLVSTLGAVETPTHTPQSK